MPEIIVRVLTLSIPVPANVAARGNVQTEMACAVVWSDDDEVNLAQLKSAVLGFIESMERARG